MTGKPVIPILMAVQEAETDLTHYFYIEREDRLEVWRALNGKVKPVTLHVPLHDFHSPGENESPI